MTDNKTGLFAGSFDPLTLGHIDLVKKARKLFAHVIVLVADDPYKKYLFDGPTRVKICQEALSAIPGVTVMRGEGLTARLAVKLRADALIRGLRSAADLALEARLEAINRFLEPQLETVFFLADPRFSFITSSNAKQLWEQGEDISALVPPAALAAFGKITTKKSPENTRDFLSAARLRQKADD